MLKNRALRMNQRLDGPLNERDGAELKDGLENEGLENEGLENEGLENEREGPENDGEYDGDGDE
jgi:hypothetical protein